MAHVHKKEIKVQKIKTEIEQKNLEGCTFRPYTNQWRKWDKARDEELKRYLEKN
jgi:hypothetical protein